MGNWCRFSVIDESDGARMIHGMRTTSCYSQSQVVDAYQVSNM